MKARSFYLEILLVSFAVLLLQISYTRIFSFKVSSYFTYLIIGFAMLGIGSGGVCVALSSRLRAVEPARLLSLLAPLAALVIGLGYFVVAGAELRLFDDATSAGQIARLTLVCGVLFASFAGMGLVLSAVFARWPEMIHRLYFADLVGAGLGCAAAIPMLLLVTPPGCIFASAVAVALTGIRPGLTLAAWRALLSGSVAALLALGAAFPGALPDPVVDPAKSLGSDQMAHWDFTSEYHAWSPVFRVDVASIAGQDDRKALIHDGQWGSNIWRFDGDLASLAGSDFGARALPFAVARPEPELLVIGAAGGFEVLAGLHFGARHVTAVELNPVTVAVVSKHFADFTGRLPENGKVTWINAEGRSYLRRDPKQYDIVYFVTPDSYATMNAAQASGFVLVESYLYTVEAIQEVLRHLAPGGILAMAFGEVDFARPLRTPRYLASARRAFEGLGIDDFAQHVLVAKTQEFPFTTVTILLQATPFSRAQREAFVAASNALPRSSVEHAWQLTRKNAIANQVIRRPREQLGKLYEDYPYDVRPVVDDSPFFWHFARFSDLLSGRVQGHMDPAVARGESALLLMLGITTVFAAVFLILPFVVVRDRFAHLTHKAPAAGYFAALGLGFMCYEISLIQKLTLFLGYPTYTLSVTLFSLLVSSGVGSLASARYAARRDRMIPLLVGAVVALTVFYLFAFASVVDTFVGHPLAVRVAVAVGALAPLGLCLGAFMPLGITTLSRATAAKYRGEYVAWAWAINGFASVIGSLLVTIFSMSFGFSTVLALAAVIYVGAGLLLRSIPLAPVEFIESDS